MATNTEIQVSLRGLGIASGERGLQYRKSSSPTLTTLQRKRRSGAWSQDQLALTRTEGYSVGIIRVGAGDAEHVILAEIVRKHQVPSSGARAHHARFDEPHCCTHGGQSGNSQDDGEQQTGQQKNAPHLREALSCSGPRRGGIGTSSFLLS